MKTCLISYSKSKIVKIFGLIHDDFFVSERDGEGFFRLDNAKKETRSL